VWNTIKKRAWHLSNKQSPTCTDGAAFARAQGGLYADPVGPKMPDIDWIATLVDGSKNFWDKVVDAFKGVGSWMKEHLNPANWFRAATMNMDPMKTVRGPVALQCPRSRWCTA
jgi:hypothetical protein